MILEWVVVVAGWVAVGLLIWLGVAVPLGLLIGGFTKVRDRQIPHDDDQDSDLRARAETEKLAWLEHHHWGRR